MSEVIGGVIGVAFGVTSFFLLLRLYKFLNKVEVESVTRQENWVTYHVNEGPRGIRKLYKRTLYLHVEGTDFYTEDGNRVGLQKWSLLTAAVIKFKMERDIIK